MLYECKVTVRDLRYIKLIYRQSVKFNRSYNVFMRVSEKLQFYAENYSPLGYIDMDGLKIKGVKVWDEEKIKKEAKLENKMARSGQSKKEKEGKKTKSQGKNKKKDEKEESQTKKEKQQPQQNEDSLDSPNNNFQNTYNFVVYKDKDKESDDDIILDIHTQSRALKTTLEKISTYSNKKSSNPLSFQPNKQFKTSIMSSENPEQNYRGFLNLAMILLVVLNLRNIVANLQKYGLQEWPTLNMHYHTYGFLFFVMGAHIAFCYGITKLQFKRVLHTRLATIINIINIVSLLIYNVAYTKYFNPGVFGSNLLTMLSSIVTLKLISYIHFNSNILHIASLLTKDDASNSKQISEVDEFVKGQVKTNLNNIQNILTIERLAYFISAPTLCYQLQYPRNSYIRKGWLAKRVAQYILSSLVMNIVVVQYVLPELATIRQYYVKPQFKISQFAYMILQLSVPVMIFWVTMFYSFFHVLLNIIGQLTKFGDRSFYLDWWNCKDHDEYWRKWNLPVHNWMLRHLYIPLTGLGFPKQTAGFAVFFVSALYHEYWIGVPLQILSFWAFLAIMSQAPLITFQKFMQKKLRIRNSELGNVVFWISFCFVGQPLVVFAYYYIYTSKE